MDPREFLTFAESLMLGERTEAATRSAISRAYYAAWHAARAHLRRSGDDIPSRNSRGKLLGSHDRVIQALAQSPSPSISGMAILLYNLKDLRTRADYELEDADVPKHVDRALQLAERTVSWAESQRSETS